METEGCLDINGQARLSKILGALDHVGFLNPDLISRGDQRGVPRSFSDALFCISITGQPPANIGTFGHLSLSQSTHSADQLDKHDHRDQTHSQSEKHSVTFVYKLYAFHGCSFFFHPLLSTSTKGISFSNSPSPPFKVEVNSKPFSAVGGLWRCGHAPHPHGPCH